MSVGQPTKTYILQLCAETWCHLEDLSGAIADRMNGRRESKKCLNDDDNDDKDNQYRRKKTPNSNQLNPA